MRRAHATLARGTGFLGAGLAADGGARSIAGPVRARVIGNGLREIDRFLNLLVQAVAVSIDLDPLSARRDTADTLARVRSALSLGGDARWHARLRAMDRSRGCLFHCNGLVRRADVRGGAYMTAGWPGHDGALRRFALGQDLAVTGTDLAGVCAFYESLAAELIAGSVRLRGIDYRADVAIGPPRPGARASATVRDSGCRGFAPA